MILYAAWNSTFFTVTIHHKDREPPEAGNYDPSVAVLVADFLKNRQRGTSQDVWRKLNNAINDFTKRTQNMYAGGKTTPWWGATAGMVDKMSYECDAKLGAPAEVDCAQLEWSHLGLDEENVDLGSTLTKVLSSSTFCPKSDSAMVPPHCVQFLVLTVVKSGRHVPASHHCRGSYRGQLATNPGGFGYTFECLPCQSNTASYRRASIRWSSSRYKWRYLGKTA